MPAVKQSPAGPDTSRNYPGVSSPIAWIKELERAGRKENGILMFNAVEFRDRYLKSKFYTNTGSLLNILDLRKVAENFVRYSL